MVERVAHINQQVGFVVPVLQVMKNVFRAPLILFVALFVVCFYFNKPRKEACVCDKMAGPAVVGMAIVENVAEDDIGAVFADGGDEPELMLLIIFEKAVSHFQVFAHFNADDLCCIRSFGVPCFSRSPRAQLSLGKIDNACLFTIFYFIDQYTGAPEFHIVGMNADGENV